MDRCSPDLVAEVRDVTYTHWNQTEPTLRGLTFGIPRGSLSVLVGPSGSGKSTICSLFNGVIPHLHGGNLMGDVWINGVNTRGVTVADLAQKVGLVFQDPETMFATLCVEDEIAFGPECLCLPANDIRTTVDQLLDVTQLKEQRHNLVWDLSGGQIQKLGLAAVLAMQPELIVLDEPTANLDSTTAEEILDLMRTLNEEEKVTFIFSTHDPQVVSRAKRVMKLKDGRLLNGKN